MATKKKRARAVRTDGLADVIALPGVIPDDVVAVGQQTYRVEAPPDDNHVDARGIVALLAGRADLPTFNATQFTTLMRSLVGLRVRAFALPFDVYDGAACSLVRKKLKAIRPSEMGRAIVGAGRDPWHRQRQSTLAAILCRVPELMALADDKAPPPPRMRDLVVADYVRLWPLAHEADWHTPRPDLQSCERHTTPMLEMHLRQMRKAIQESRRIDEQTKKEVLR